MILLGSSVIMITPYQFTQHCQRSLSSTLSLMFILRNVTFVSTYMKLLRLVKIILLDDDLLRYWIFFSTSGLRAVFLLHCSFVIGWSELQGWLQHQYCQINACKREHHYVWPSWFTGKEGRTINTTVKDYYSREIAL